jgi:NADH-quinone oxidoreductase subunit L
VFEFARQYAWLIPALPLAACVLIGIFGRWLKGLAHVPAWLAMIGSCALSLSLLFGINANPEGAILNKTLFEWFHIGNFHIDVSITVDQLTALYLSFITGIGLLIFIYAAAYMKGDYGYWRFFAYLSIFVFFMCMLVMGSNFILLYLGWEGVGLASYLLIGYYYPRPSAVAAAKKAFIVNRIGDFFLAIGIFLIYWIFGSVNYHDIFFGAGTRANNGEFVTQNWALLKFVPYCLMLGAFGKSAQFPLHVWLPDAMEGPTPVSALIHAATMVTAGVYLIARTFPLFQMDGLFIGDHQYYALGLVACIGGTTAFLAATMAMCQYDLKKIWAYSTLSQLGYMFLGLGVLAKYSAVFHVFTHAWFKALLFLSAGSVMHAMGGELDIRKMSGVRKVMPITHITMLVGCLALAGVPGLAGFFSKDEILAAALNADAHRIPQGYFLGLLGVLVALITAYYTFRLYFKVFWGPLELPATAGHHEPSPFALADNHAHHGHGKDTLHAKQGHEEASHGEDSHGHAVGAGHGHDTHAHGPNDGSPLLWLPLLVLCIGAIGAGYLGVMGGTHGEGAHHGGWIHSFLGQYNGGIDAHTVSHAGQAAGEAVVGHAVAGEAAAAGQAGTPEVERVSHSTMMIISGVIAIVGILIAAYFYLINRAASAAMARRFRPLVNFLYNKWYIDDLYYFAITKPLWITAHLLSLFDRFVVDMAVNVVGYLPSVVGYSLKPTQRGLLQRYAVGMIAGVAAIVVFVLYLLR